MKRACHASDEGREVALVQGVLMSFVFNQNPSKESILDSA